jgi:hypothetical protein
MTQKQLHWLALIWGFLAPAALCAAEVAPTQSLPASTLTLSTPPQTGSEGYTDSNDFYQSSFTNHSYKLLGNRLFAIHQRNTFQYYPVDVWPSEGSVDIFMLEQAKTEDQSGFDHRSPITLGNAGKPLLSLPTGDLTSYSIVQNGKTRELGSLPDNDARNDISTALLVHSTRVCCTAEGSKAYYSLSSGKKLLEHSWTDSGFIEDSSELYSTNDKGDWLLLHTHASTPAPDSRELAIRLTVNSSGNAGGEVNFKATLPQTFSKMCGNWCYLNISTPTAKDEETLPYLPSPAPVTISFGGEDGKSTPLAILRILPDGVPALKTLDTKSTSNSLTK